MEADAGGQDALWQTDKEREQKHTDRRTQTTNTDHEKEHTDGQTQTKNKNTR